MNKLNWRTTQVDDDRVLYLRIMRDMKEYSKKGYIETVVLLCSFLLLPMTYVRRIYRTAEKKPREIYVLQWNDKGQVRAFITDIIAYLCALNHQRFNPDAFEEAFEEFTQYIKSHRAG